MPLGTESQTPILTEFIESLAARNASGRTLQTYRSAIEKFFQHVPEDVKDVTDVHADNFITMLGNTGYKPATINLHVAALKTFFGFCAQHKHCPRNPFQYVRGAKLEESLPKSVPYLELQGIIESIDGTDFISLRDRALFELGYAIGARANDLRQANIEHLSLAKKMLHIPNGKGGTDAIIPFGNSAKGAIQAYLTRREEDGIGTNNDALFVNTNGDRLSGIWNIVKKHTKIPPHQLFRHSAATHFLQNGATIMEVKDLLRHKSIRTTQMYTGTSQDRLRQVYDLRFMRN